MFRKRTIIAFSGLLTLLLLTGAILLSVQEKVSPEAYRAAFAALDAYRTEHPQERPQMLAVADYTKPSYLKRMALIDLKTGEQTFHLVAHGKRSGELYARFFSDTPESNMSSPGLYRVLDPYRGDHGTAMRLEGLEPGRNGNAFRRDIVLHSADYVSLRYILLNLVTFNGPRIGRSNGCFVVSRGDIEDIVNRFGSDGFLYAWAEEPEERE